MFFFHVTYENTAAYMQIKEKKKEKKVKEMRQEERRKTPKFPLCRQFVFVLFCLIYWFVLPPG